MWVILTTTPSTASEDFPLLHHSQQHSCTTDMPLDTSQTTHYSRFSEHREDRDSSLSLPPLNPPAPSPRSVTSYRPRPQLLTRTPTRLKPDEHYAISPRITVLTAAVIIPTVILATAFWYVLFHNQAYISNGNLFSDIPANVPLFIGTITSTVVSLLTTIVMVLFAYRLGQLWINAEHNGRAHELPDAEQFAFLLKMCSGSSIFVIFEFLLYASPLSLHPNGYSLVIKRKKTTVKPILQLAASVFAFTMFLTLAVQGTDVWVHKTLQSTTFSAVDQAPTTLQNYSRVLRADCFDNSSKSASISLNGYVDDSCVFGSDGFLYDPIETFATATNTSNINTILNQEQIAYIAPAITAPSISFVAQTVGVQTKCQPITSLCILESPSSGYASFTCGSGYEALSGLLYSNQFFEVDMLNGTQVVNPFHIGAYGCFKDYAKTFPSVSPKDFLDVSSFNTGIYIGTLQSCTILACEVEISNLNYTSRLPDVNADDLSTNITLLHGEKYRSSLQTTKALTGAISQSYGVDQLSLGITSAAIRSNTSSAFSAFVALTLSQTILGQSAGAFESAPSLEEEHVTTRIGTRAPLIPIIIFLGFQVILVLWCMIIAAWSMGVDRSNGAQAVKNARHGLIDVKTLVMEHFGNEAVYPPATRDAGAEYPQRHQKSPLVLSMRGVDRASHDLQPGSPTESIKSIATDEDIFRH